MYVEGVSKKGREAGTLLSPANLEDYNDIMAKEI